MIFPCVESGRGAGPSPCCVRRARRRGPSGLGVREPEGPSPAARPRARSPEPPTRCSQLLGRFHLLIPPLWRPLFGQEKSGLTKVTRRRGLGAYPAQHAEAGVTWASTVNVADGRPHPLFLGHLVPASLRSRQSREGVSGPVCPPGARCPRQGCDAATRRRRKPRRARAAPDAGPGESASSRGRAGESLKSLARPGRKTSAERVGTHRPHANGGSAFCAAASVGCPRRS